LRRSAYMKVGGFPKIGFSICEDVRLSQAILKEYGAKGLHYHLDVESTPTTDPEPLRKLGNMKIRWSMELVDLGWVASYSSQSHFSASVVATLRDFVVRK